MERFNPKKLTAAIPFPVRSSAAQMRARLQGPMTDVAKKLITEARRHIAASSPALGPRKRYGPRGSNATGELANSFDFDFDSDVRGRRKRYYLRIYSDAEHFNLVSEGWSNNGGPPVYRVKEWVEQKFGISASTPNYTKVSIGRGRPIQYASLIYLLWRAMSKKVYRGIQLRALLRERVQALSSAQGIPGTVYTRMWAG